MDIRLSQREMSGINCQLDVCILVSINKFKATIWAISSDIHHLQFIKLHHFKLERFKSI